MRPGERRRSPVLRRVRRGTRGSLGRRRDTQGGHGCLHGRRRLDRARRAARSRVAATCDVAVLRPMQATLERHGGTVEKFIGDAIVAVFGVPAVHEDDALRAVRAAFEMREGLERVNDELEREYGVRIATRTGVNTGEVIVGGHRRGPEARDRRRGQRRSAARAGRAAAARCSSASRRITSFGMRSSSRRHCRRGEGEEPAARGLEGGRPPAGRARLCPRDRNAVRRSSTRARRAPSRVRQCGARLVVRTRHDRRTARDR